jgi:hypothetical protein
MAGVSASSAGVSREQRRGQRERGGACGQQLSAGPAERLGRAEQPLDPLHRVGGGGGEPRREAGGGGEHRQGGGQRPGAAARGGRVVGVHLDQPGDLRIRIPHQRDEGQDPAADSRDGQQPVVVAGQVRPLVRQDGIELAGIQRLPRGGGQDHRRVRPRDAVGRWLLMVDQRRTEVRVRAPDQAGGLRVPRRLPPDGAQVGRRGSAVRASTDPARVRPS